jgi:hypothetical protein
MDGCGQSVKLSTEIMYTDKTEFLNFFDIADAFQNFANSGGPFHKFVSPAFLGAKQNVN